MELIFLLLFGSLFLSSLGASPDGIVTYLEPEDLVNYTPSKSHIGFKQNELRIYCYRGAGKTLSRLFETIELQLEITDDDYTQYEGVTPSEVLKHFDEHRSLFSFNIFTQKRTRLQISPFGQHCIGIETAQAYRVKLKQFRVDIWNLIQLTIGIILFLYAGELSSNTAFYYMAGIAIGICSSFMLLIWLAGKLVPKRPVMYGVVIGGWALGAYLLQIICENIQVILITYKSYVFWYITTTGLISFLFCYRWGPPTNTRSKNIIKWTLQFFAIIFIYNSSNFEEAIIALMLITVLVLYFPRSVLGKLYAFYRRRFPPKRRLLTNEEFHEQGVQETANALEELRKFASSPDCKQWRLMSQLKDPYRFAAFVEGSSHLRDEEILSFESSIMEDNYDDDESENSLNEEVNVLNEELSEDDDDDNDNVTVQRNPANLMFPPQNRYIKSRVRSINFTSPPSYASSFSTSYADVSSTQQRHNRAARMVNTATSTSYRRSGHGRPPLNHSDSEG